MDLFEETRKRETARNAPLARRMSPVSLEEFVGQEHILGPGKMLRRSIEADRLSSLILYGPPGTGKTALARVIAHSTRAEFATLNAVTSGVAEIREVVSRARDLLGQYQKRTILFVDEIHRFNKAQQDALLPYVEEGLVVLIGATTENPNVEVIRALLSRSLVYRLEPLSGPEIRRILTRALADSERGYGNRGVEVDDAALNHLVEVADGDARRALNSLELAVLTTAPTAEGTVRIGLEVAVEAIQRRPPAYDRQGDNHYDAASAFIKSLRASRPDAALHYLARMLEAGEDPRFITRRMMIFAGEDVGLADPRALSVAVDADYALKNLGMPEAVYPLSLACLYLARAPKSNDAKSAIQAAAKDIREGRAGEIPVFLRDLTIQRPGREPGSREKSPEPYLYPPDHGYQTGQEYMPETLRGRRYSRFPTETTGEEPGE